MKKQSVEKEVERELKYVDKFPIMSVKTAIYLIIIILVIIFVLYFLWPWQSFCC